MAVKYIKGDFFDREHSPGHAAFGFTGSAGAPDTSQRSDQGPPPGSMRGMPRQMADGGTARLHPFGHSDVMRTEKRFDGTYVEHHAHGGKTVHHLDGQVTHHQPNGGQVFCDGGQVGYKRGGKAQAKGTNQDKKLLAAEHAAELAEMSAPPPGPPPGAPPPGPPAGAAPPGAPPPDAPPDQAPAGMKAGGRAYAKGGAMKAKRPASKPDDTEGPEDVEGGDDAEDKAMIRSAVHQHEKNDHGPGAYTNLKLRIGGTVRIPRSMTPVAERHRSPIETPPRKPQVTRTPTNSMPGGVAPYGVQPSTESGYQPTSPTGAAPDDSGAPPGGMKRGGRAGR